MTVMNAPREDADERVEEAFIELICTVDALVEAEFEDIVCARRMACPPIEGRTPPGPSAGLGSDARRARSRPRSVARQVRAAATERSPPPRSCIEC
ncbi:hypothetical protein [Microbacterium mangrovi]|nr:hypothetical protein [Microbacterium mangrovi]